MTAPERIAVSRGGGRIVTCPYGGRHLVGTHWQGFRCPICDRDRDVCGCGHPPTTHHLTPGGTRTWCSTWDTAGGRCGCNKYEESTDGD